MKEDQIVLNRLQCLECGEVLTSYHVHDYNTCGCKNHTSIDGGTAYLRYGGVDMDKIALMTVYLDMDDFELMRDSFHWGTRGKDGKQPLKFVPLCDMSNAHIKKIVDTLVLTDWIEQLFLAELNYRNVNQITI